MAAREVGVEISADAGPEGLGVTDGVVDPPVCRRRYRGVRRGAGRRDGRPGVGRIAALDRVVRIEDRRLDDADHDLGYNDGTSRHLISRGAHDCARRGLHRRVRDTLAEGVGRERDPED